MLCGKTDTLGNGGYFHEAVMQGHAAKAVGEILGFRSLILPDVWLFRREHCDEENPLIHGMDMPEMIGEHERNPHSRRREESSCAWNADRRACQHIGKEFLFGLTQARAHLFGDLLAVPPGQHQE